jgi:DNA invertase Pin-like site-specific DNA recombinase
MDGRFVAYYRASTEHQGANGNGMEAQRKAVADYLNGGNCKIVDEFTEVESGKRVDNRPELEKALAGAKKYKGHLNLGEARPISAQRPFHRRSDGAQGQLRLL